MEEDKKAAVAKRVAKRVATRVVVRVGRVVKAVARVE